MLKWPVNAQPVFSSVGITGADGTIRFPHPIGARAEDHFGREYHYALAGAVDLVVGNWLQSSAQITNHQHLTPSVGSIGDVQITATAGATAASANDYAGGICVIDTTPGIGYSYPIAWHASWTSGAVAGGVVVNFTKGWAEVVAITAASGVTLIPNPYARVIQGPANTLTNTPLGVCQFIISANQAGWIGTKGHYGTLIQGTPAVGQSVSAPGTAAGALAIQSGTLPVCGFMMQTGVNGQVNGVNWIL